MGEDDLNPRQVGNDANWTFVTAGAFEVMGLKAPFQFDPWAFALNSSVGNTLLLTRDGTLWSWGARLSVPPPSPKLRTAKLRVNQFLYRLSGKPAGFSLQNESVNAAPRSIWSLPVEMADGASGR